MGIGDPPRPVKVVRHGDIAALVSDVSTAYSLGSLRDLTVHAQILDSSASAVPVLPMRFGAMLRDPDEVASELLAANHDMFAAALGELEGRVQYVVKGRYREEVVLREVLSENSEAARLRDRIRQAPPGAQRDAQIRLGEIVSDAIAVKREHDTRAVAGRLARHCDASVVREPRHERDAVHIAMLVRTTHLDALRQAVAEVASGWHRRVDFRLLGPTAAYDFVVTTATGPA